MLFPSFEFLFLLLCLFPLYYLLPKLTKGKYQWVLLLAFSYLYYYLSGAQYLIFILFTTFTSFGVAVLMQRRLDKETTALKNAGDTLTREERKAVKTAGKKQRKRILIVGMLLNFGMLALLKYTAPFLAGCNVILHRFGVENGMIVPDLILPLGISFYTFQSMGYLIDVYRGKVRGEQNPARLMLFVSFFPQLVQGPISRYSDLAPQLYLPHAFSGESFTKGLQRILWGYCKKLIVADRALVAIRSILDNPEGYPGCYVVFLILLYSVEIYADFTGGIDITIGIAEALGIRLTENFRKPFSSRSTEEYWKRWHITMGTWFQDYVFYPLAVSPSMQRLSRFSREKFGNGIGRRLPVYLCTVVTWFLTGLWHGARWNFVVWGLLNCLVLLVSQELKPLYLRFHTRFPRLISSPVYINFTKVRTFLLMGSIRVLDCYQNVPLTFRMFGTVFTTPNAGAFFSKGGVLSLGLSVFDFVLLTCGILVMFAVSKCGDEKRSLRDKLWERPLLSASLTGAALFALLLFGAYGIGYDASQFIYAAV